MGRAALPRHGRSRLDGFADREGPAIRVNSFDSAGGDIHVSRRMIHHMDEGIS